MSTWIVNEYGSLVESQITLPYTGYWIVTGFSIIGAIYEFQLNNNK